MLEKLCIRNFQKHRKLDLAFHPGITTIIGATDSGKSAVYRALKLVCLNRPQGTAYITAGEESTKVTLYFDGRKVARSRGPKTNAYGLDGATYLAMGQEVPDKVREALGVSALNFQSQHDSAYWFGEADGKVAKELNAIVNLGEIDELFTRLNAAHRSAKAEYEVRVKNVDSLRAKKRESERVVEMDAALTSLETLDAEIRDREAQAGVLSVLVTEASNAKAKRAELRGLLSDLDRVRTAGDEAAEAWRKSDALAKLLAHALTLKSQLVVIPDTTKLTEAHDAWQASADGTARLAELLDTLRGNYRVRKAAQTEYDTAVAEANKHKPAVCSKCGQTLPHNHGH